MSKSKDKMESEFWDLMFDKAVTKKKQKSSVKPKQQEMRYKLGSEFKGVYFSQREAECMVFLLQEKSAREVGEELGLSRKTVEFYISNMRDKLGCGSKVALIAKVRKSDFPKFQDIIIQRIKNEKPKILLVEDHPQIQKINSEALMAITCKVDVAGTVTEAMELIMALRIIKQQGEGHAYVNA